MKIKSSLKLLIFGFLFGMIFPVMAILYDIYTKKINGINEIFNFSSYIILIIIPFFIGLFFYVFGRYREKNEILEKLRNKKEYEINLKLILDNLNSGICLIDKQFNILNGYNVKFEDIFGKGDYEGKNILDTIFKGVSYKLKKEIEEFLTLVFNNITASNEMINDISPIKRFEYVIAKNDGKIEIKILSIKVVRIFDKDKNKVNQVLLLFNDITLNERLKNEIKIKEEEFKEKYEIIISLLSIDQEIIKKFINSLENVMQFIKEKLRSIKQDQVNSEILSEVIKKIHSLKGESFSLGFKGISEASKELELFLKEIKNKTIDLDKTLNIISIFEKLQYQKDFLYKNIKDLELAVTQLSSNSKRKVNQKIENLEKYFKSVIENTNIIENIKDIEIKKENENKSSISEDNKNNDNSKNINYINDNYREKTSDSQNFYVELLKKELNLILDKSKELLGKDVELKFNSELDNLPEIIYDPIKEILLHLIRNSISHGIETENERITLGKPEKGIIEINIKRKDGNKILIVYSDDGSGIDYDKVLKKAIELKLISEDEAKKLNKNGIIKFIFSEDFSTSNEKNMVAGTGVGMSVIKDNVLKELGGSIRVKNIFKKGLKFEIEIPIRN